ncbi:MAG: hypothetical protein FWG92_00570 [Leptospirales bacterium]|nr:hypothetical protein [Leptospirales bacterium]
MRLWVFRESHRDGIDITTIPKKDNVKIYAAYSGTVEYVGVPGWYYPKFISYTKEINKKRMTNEKNLFIISMLFFI